MTVNGAKYIRTDANKQTEDNLGYYQKYKLGSILQG